MDYTFSNEATELRARLRTLITESFDDSFLGAWSTDPSQYKLTQDFCRRLAEENLLTIAWPTEYGGRGGSVWDQTVVREEMWAGHEPRGPQYMGVNWVGPALMTYGTDAQKHQHLPAIAHGEVAWCQGFSEPEAGSDLVSLRTRAVRDGDGWRIDGQKIWTSYAGWADWCVLAVRTGTTGRPHDGITVFLVPMDRAGIEVRPIDSIIGPHHLNEVFFENVRAEDAEILGEEGRGWEVILGALAHERIGIARYARAERLLRLTIEHVDELGIELPKALRARLLRALVDARTNRLLAYRAVTEGERGNLSGFEAAIARLGSTRGDQMVAELLVEVLGIESLDAPGSSSLVLHAAVEEYYRYSMAATVASGTAEVQQLIISRELIAGAR